MSATDSLDIIRELQGLVINDRAVEQYICDLWSNTVHKFGARGTAVLAEVPGGLTVLSHSQNQLVGQTLPMPQAYDNGLAELAAPMPQGWHVLPPSAESAKGDRYYLALELHDHELANPEFCTQISDLATLCYTLIWAAQLKQQNTLLSNILDSINYGIAVSDAHEDDHPLVYVNPAFEALTGYTAEETLGHNCRFMSAEPPDSHVLQELRDTIQKRAPGGFTLRNKHKSGREFLN
jgi:PAS domain S-box-containing protein